MKQCKHSTTHHAHAHTNKPAINETMEQPIRKSLNRSNTQSIKHAATPTDTHTNTQSDI